MDIGDVVCDMHDGIPDHLECRSHIRINTRMSGSLVTLLLRAVESKQVYPRNKIALVIGETNSGWWQAVYSYDGMTLGIFEFRHKEKT